MRDAGIDDFRWHDLRHTFASRLVIAGVDIRTVQELLGHKSIVMTMKYSHMSHDHRQIAAEKIGAARSVRSSWNFPLPIAVISSILGPYGPIEKVAANRPLSSKPPSSHGVFSDLTAVAAIATIAAESGTFAPVKEKKGGPTYLANVYEDRKDLGN